MVCEESGLQDVSPQRQNKEAAFDRWEIICISKSLTAVAITTGELQFNSEDIQASKHFSFKDRAGCSVIALMSHSWILQCLLTTHKGNSLEEGWFTLR